MQMQQAKVASRDATWQQMKAEFETMAKQNNETSDQSPRNGWKGRI
jgi:hypothetical protein